MAWTLKSILLWELCDKKYAQMLHKVMLDKWRLTMKQFSTIINTLIEHDLTIEKILEPLPDSEAIQKLPSLEKEHRRPSLLLIRARK